MTAEQLARRNAAIRAAWDDPLLRATHMKHLRKEDSKRSSDEAYNAYYRDYRRRKRDDSDRVP